MRFSGCMYMVWISGLYSNSLWSSLSPKGSRVRVWRGVSGGAYLMSDISLYEDYIWLLSAISRNAVYLQGNETIYSRALRNTIWLSKRCRVANRTEPCSSNVQSPMTWDRGLVSRHLSARRASIRWMSRALGEVANCTYPSELENSWRIVGAI